MACQNCGLRKDQHEYQRDGGMGSGAPKYGIKHKGYCEMYLSPNVENGYYLGKDCVCGHYRTNHRTVKGDKWIGQCKGQTGCAGHEPCRCKEYREKKTTVTRKCN